ncbi:MAG: hypothetical protein H6733_03540 [Alphaproteobacteria bacterium]|nr:hypothetical protein [Alphaproteobacteria bacterium]
MDRRFEGNDDATLGDETAYACATTRGDSGTMAGTSAPTQARTVAPSSFDEDALRTYLRQPGRVLVDAQREGGGRHTRRVRRAASADRDDDERPHPALGASMRAGLLVGGVWGVLLIGSFVGGLFMAERLAAPAAVAAMVPAAEHAVPAGDPPTPVPVLTSVPAPVVTPAVTPVLQARVAAAPIASAGVDAPPTRAALPVSDGDRATDPTMLGLDLRPFLGREARPLPAPTVVDAGVGVKASPARTAASTASEGPPSASGTDRPGVDDVGLDAHIDAGWALLDSKPMAARTHFELARAMDPANVQARFGLGYVQLALGRSDKALGLLCPLLRDGPADIRSMIQGRLDAAELACAAGPRPTEVAVR